MIIDKSYSTFRHEVTTPLRQTAEDEYVMELWHGPTWAFKDVALQFLGNVFAYFLERRNQGKKEEEKEQLTVVGATSGDTGRRVPRIWKQRGHADETAVRPSTVYARNPL